jgi:hypothetical protein
LQYKIAEERYEEAATTLEQLWRKIRDESGLIDATPQSIHQLAQRLQEQRETLEVEEAGDAGRRAGIEQAIDHLSVTAAKKAASDEVSAELQKVVDIRQKSLDQYRAAGKSIPEAELLTAERELAAVRAELAAARQRASGAATETIDAWNRDLLNLNIAQQERLQKLAFIKERLEKLAPALTESDELERKSEQLAGAARERDAAFTALRILQMNSDPFRQ